MLDEALASDDTNKAGALLKFMAKKASIAYTEKQEETRQSTLSDPQIQRINTDQVKRGS